MKRIMLLLLILLFVSCTEKTQDTVKGQYMGLQESKTPRLLMPELIASPLDEYNGTFSSDGTEFYYTTNTPTKGIITFTRLNDEGVWENPKVASFSGIHSEYDPLFSPSEDRLYFTSERPTGTDGEVGETNIWYVDKEKDSWSEAQMLSLDKSGVYYSSITNKGDIYFNIWNTGDMYKATKKSDSYEVTRLDSILNSSNGEGDPFISPSEDYLIFRGYNNSLGQGDLYISFNLEGNWTEPENLGEPINSAAHEMCPYVTTNGKFFIFASKRIEQEYESKPMSKTSDVVGKFQSYDNGNLNIYYMSTDFISEMKAKYQN